MNVRNNKLFLEGVEATKLASKYGTPLYVYVAKTIKERIADFTDNFDYKNLKIHYAVKANNNVQILKLLRELGTNVETVSMGAINLAFEAGFKPEQIIHTCNGMTDDEIKFLIKNRITTNIDSLGQLETWGKLNPESDISIRLNLDIGAGGHEYLVTGGGDSKFGIHISHIEKALSIAAKHNLKIIGLQQHIGSDAFMEPDLFIKAIQALTEVASGFEGLEFLDFGGSFGVPYRAGEKRLDMKKLGEEFTKAINNFIKTYGREIVVILEPGKYLMSESGILLAKVTDVKQNPEKLFVSVDSGMNHLIRPALYDAYHEILNASKTSEEANITSVVGNICESSDFFAKDRLLPKFEEGDILAILNAGAYGYSMSSNYNSRPRPAEVLIDTGKVTLIREREKI